MSDTSDYIRRKKLAAINNGNQAADSRKFRAPTRDTAYDPYLSTGQTCAVVGIDVCNATIKHNLFAAQKFTKDYMSH